jgi:hypothetical protein
MGREEKERREVPPPRDFDIPPPGSDRKKSFSEGEVHRIIFKASGGQKKLYRSIYRKINSEEYNNLIKSIKIVSTVYPSLKDEHSEDVYYVRKDKRNNVKSYSYLSLENIEELKKDFPNQDIKFELIPLKDIYEKGINAYPISYESIYKDYEQIEKNREKGSKDIEKKAQQADIEKEKGKGGAEYTIAREKALKFTLDRVVDDVLTRLVGYYNGSLSIRNTTSSRSDFSKKLDELIDKLVVTVKKINDPLFEKAFLDIIKDQYKSINKTAIFDKIKEKMKTGAPEVPDKDGDTPKDSIEKNLEPVVKKSAPAAPRVKAEPTKDTSEFLKFDQYRGMLNKAIQSYSNSIDPEETEEERRYQKNKFLDDKIDLIDAIFKYVKKEKISDPDIVFDTEIKKYIEDFIKDKEVYEKLIQNLTGTYSTMKQKIQKESLNEAPQELDSYEVELKDSKDKLTDKERETLQKIKQLYTDKKVPKAFSKKNTYIRKLDPTQKSQLEKSPAIKSVTKITNPEDLKGYLSTSASFRDKEKSSVIRFDPKNPKHVANLAGKTKPGDKVYKVSIKFSSGANWQQSTMPKSKIEKLVPDVKFVEKIEQPFEQELFRAVSKDTGEKIYDKVKGLFRFDSTTPVLEPKDDEKKGQDTSKSNLPPPAQYGTKTPNQGKLTSDYYLVDMSNPDFPNGVVVRDPKDDTMMGFSSRNKAEEEAIKIGGNVEVYQRLKAVAKRVSTENPKYVNKSAGTKTFKYYIIANGKVLKDEKGNALGTDDKGEADVMASKKGPDAKVATKEDLKKIISKTDAPKVPGNKFADYVKTWGEAVENEKELVSKQISFNIKSNPKDPIDPKNPKDPDVEGEVSGNAKSATFNKKDGLVITMDDNSQVIFSNEDTGKYYKNPQDKNTFSVVSFVPQNLSSVLKKVFSPSKEPSKTESKLESYIRKRIKRALQETELSQYMGVQGPEVKKKRLEEYMKKYEWGFQKSEDPYVRSNGTEKHSIVNKLVHELGDEGVAIFNSYAPKGFEISRPDNLNDLADSPLGSQMARPFEPNTLTMRGGRVAEDGMWGPVEPKGQKADQLTRIIADPQSSKIVPVIKKAIKNNKSVEELEGLIKIIRDANSLKKPPNRELTPEEEKYYVTDQQIYDAIKNYK